ncbi:DUF4402 domain-containing protein [Paraurantiacibacter namhicola]|uniref:DUF4402 domain-containing protein n=1 Tax=Paraurantiacibacter namhicola TaxID=645517 RepID=A0A1C7D5W0_9SPHN|nr:DUF4402 domain-containing protein [Paraurantiacibacter namhicola]ANU06742.1 hypothetical protein A6F65_00417 [Paraurantiacibacter namhicola]
MKFTKIAATGAALVSLAVAGQAQAATQASADVRAEVLSALSVTVDATDNVLNFGTVADGGLTADVDVIVNADGTRGSTCPATLICGGTLATPTFTIAGLAGRSVQVTFQNATETLSHAAPPAGTDGTMTVKDFTTSLTGNAATLPAGGTQDFTVGGTLTVGPNQAEGTYSGTVTVNVAYN